MKREQRIRVVCLMNEKFTFQKHPDGTIDKGRVICLHCRKEFVNKWVLLESSKCYSCNVIRYKLKPFKWKWTDSSHIVSVESDQLIKRPLNKVTD